MRRLIRTLTLLVLLVGVGLAGMVFQVQWIYADAIRAKPAEADAFPIAIVLGASVKTDGTASDALVDRVATGVELYKLGKAKKLLMTGDDGKFHTNEVAAMKKLAEESGVPAEDILVDGHGYRTYESCKRAKQEFSIGEALVVTQRFHLGRALYLCGHFMDRVQGVPADRQAYQRIVFFTARDLASSVKAWWDIHVMEPTPPVTYAGN